MDNPTPDELLADAIAYAALGLLGLMARYGVRERLPRSRWPSIECLGTVTLVGTPRGELAVAFWRALESV